MTNAFTPLTGTNLDDTLLGGNNSEVLSGRDGNDVIYANSGSDEAWGGKGDDYLTGNNGEDILYGDGGPSYAELSDLTITYDHPVTVTFQWEGAGYRNTFGWYKIESETGQIYNTEIIWENASRTGSGGDLVPGVTQKSLDVDAGDQIGFFIISNGYSQNLDFFNSTLSNQGYYEFRNADGTIAAVTDTNPSLYHIANDGTATLMQSHDYHTAAYDSTLPLNSDGILHTVGQLDTTNGTLELGFEDLYNGGDLDFDDTVFSVDIGQANAEVLNAHAKYGDGGYQVTGQRINIISDQQNDLDYLQTGYTADDFWDLRNIEATNTTDTLKFSVSLYQGGFNPTLNDGEFGLFLSTENIPVTFDKLGHTVVLPDRSGIIVTVSIISGSVNLSMNSVTDGVSSAQLPTSSSSAVIINGTLKVTLDLDELGYSMGEQINWNAYVKSSISDDIALDIYDMPSSITITSFNDTVEGNNGNDTLFGLKGDDSLLGGNGSDLLQGGTGQDQMTGGSGKDTLKGGEGADQINGGKSNDHLSGGKGDDTLYGDDANDLLEGQSGDDHLDGGSGQDSLVGSSGSDTLYGGSGDDDLSGGSSDDYLSGGDGNDSLNGGSGIDTASYSEASKSVRVDLKSGEGMGHGNDQLVSIENLVGSDYNDKLYANHLANVLSGGDGNDRLYGRHGSDTLLAGDGADYIDGGSGNDVIYGGAGDDEIKGYKGADQISGGTGSDTFVYRSLAEVGDFISDFDTGGNEDIIDISAIFTGFGILDTTDIFDDYVQFSNTAENSVIVEFDQTGSGATWDTTLLTLTDFSADQLDESQFYLG
ncbi:MAG: DUF4114 domain-containing protein [Pseudomonas marincola]